TKSVDCTLTWIPTAASSAWMNWASRSATVPVGTIRFTVGFETPEDLTSCFAWFGLNAVHLMLLSNHELEGEIGVQPGRTVWLNTTLLSVFRLIASSNALRSLALEASGVPTF